jgi:hypothetical protein
LGLIGGRFAEVVVLVVLATMCVAGGIWAIAGAVVRARRAESTSVGDEAERWLQEH